MRSVAQEFRVSLCTVQWWTKRAHGCRLDRVDWTNRPPIPHHVQHTERATEALRGITGKRLTYRRTYAGS